MMLFNTPGGCAEFGGIYRWRFVGFVMFWCIGFRRC